MAHPPQSSTATLKPSANRPKTFSDGLPLPQLLVFDLDYTLWPFWVDTHVAPPLRAVDGGLAVQDRGGDKFTFYADVAAILGAASKQGISMSCASRTQDPDLARQMLRLLRIPLLEHDAEDRSTKPAHSSTASTMLPLDLFIHPQIYPGSKKSHFRALHKATDIPYAQMLFFDDEMRNRDVESLGVVMWHVPRGLSIAEMDKGVKAWRNRVGDVEET